MARRRLGLLGPIIVIAGLVIGGLGVWFMISNRPTAGVVIDEIPLDDKAKIVVRGETAGERSYVELHVDGDLKWQALVPLYGGRPGTPGIAWSDKVLSVRVVRDHKAELFAIAMQDASKLGGVHLAPDKGPIKLDAPGPVTLTDHVRSYEIISGEGWHQLAAVALDIGRVVWTRDLGPVPVDAGGIESGFVWIQQGTGKRWFNVFSGKEDRSIEKIGPPPQGGVPPPWPTTPDRDSAPASTPKPL
ncbi:MAG: hypothetical protein JWP01_2162 [Myxococcales bacterium]|nr:hypothetical protein [Myxococcales bacterium]